MQATYSILPTLRKEKKKNSQHALVMIRITVAGQRAEISIKRKIDPGRWDSHANKMRGNMEDAREINSLLDLLILILNRIHNKLVENEETITARKIKNIFLGKDVSKKTLLEVKSGFGVISIVLLI